MRSKAEFQAERSLRYAENYPNVIASDRHKKSGRYFYRHTCLECGKDKGYALLKRSNRVCKPCLYKNHCGKYVRTDEHKRKFRESIRNSAPRVGTKHSESTKQVLSIKQKEYCAKHGNQFVTGTSKGKHSQESRAKMSLANIGKEPQWKGRVFQYSGVNGFMKLRSSWELAYANWLDSQGIKWIYEPLFKLSNGKMFSPDFQLQNGDIIEIKGYWSKTGLEKWSLFEKDYPNINKKVLQKQDLIDLEILKGA